ncbi:hypothetical protein RRG08_038162 [Elysia crispata]|uniref:Uncharacterized protein n=1 Tax=Elysia crispata TaxID=231223 RepID=A0AAE1DX49_9GAST|nr:hypothetical protein RRG08_038162 [Elysia crispata]
MYQFLGNALGCGGERDDADEADVEPNQINITDPSVFIFTKRFARVFRQFICLQNRYPALGDWMPVQSAVLYRSQVTTLPTSTNQLRLLCVVRPHVTMLARSNPPSISGSKSALDPDQIM